MAALDEKRGLIVLAYVVLRAGTEPGPEKAAELQAFVKQSIALQVPTAVRFVAEPPKTGTGKIRRYHLREIAADGQ